MSTQTYNGWESWDHWQTALWISNHQAFYEYLQEKTEQAVYNLVSKDHAVNCVFNWLCEVTEKTPDGAVWQRDVVARLLDEEYDEMIQYS